MTGELGHPTKVGYFSKTSERIEEHVKERSIKEGSSARVFYVFQIDLLIADLERIKDGLIASLPEKQRAALGPTAFDEAERQ